MPRAEQIECCRQGCVSLEVLPERLGSAAVRGSVPPEFSGSVKLGLSGWKLVVKVLLRLQNFLSSISYDSE